MFGASCRRAVGLQSFSSDRWRLITYLPLYLKESMGFSAYWASQALAITQAGAMFGRVGWGAASDRLFVGRRKIVLLIIGIMGSVLLVALSFMSRQSPTLSALARGISFGSLSSRISRRVLRLDRRAGWKSQNRRGFGAHDHHQRRRRYSGDASVRLYRGQERILCDCLAGACGRRRSGLRGARRISQRAATPGRTFP